MNEVDIDTNNDYFQVDSIPKADWAVRKILKLQDKIAEIETAAKQMKREYTDKVNEWRDNEIKSLIADVDRLSVLLKPYVAEEIEGSKKKSINLPSGTVGFSKQGAKFYIGDKEADGKSDKLLDFIESNDYTDFVVTHKAVDWSGFKKTLTVTDDGKVITSDGEIIDFMNGVPAGDKFYVKGGSK